MRRRVARAAAALVLITVVGTAAAMTAAANATSPAQAVVTKPATSAATPAKQADPGTSVGAAAAGPMAAALAAAMAAAAAAPAATSSVPSATKRQPPSGPSDSSDSSTAASAATNVSTITAGSIVPKAARPSAAAVVDAISAAPAPVPAATAPNATTAVKRSPVAIAKLANSSSSGNAGGTPSSKSTAAISVDPLAAGPLADAMAGAVSLSATAVKPTTAAAATPGDVTERPPVGPAESTTGSDASNVPGSITPSMAGPLAEAMADAVSEAAAAAPKPPPVQQTVEGTRPKSSNATVAGVSIAPHAAGPLAAAMVDAISAAAPAEAADAVLEPPSSPPPADVGPGSSEGEGAAAANASGVAAGPLTQYAAAGPLAEALADAISAAAVPAAAAAAAPKEVKRLQPAAPAVMPMTSSSDFTAGGAATNASALAASTLAPYTAPTGLVKSYAKIVPGPSLISEPDLKLFKVYPGCRTRAYGVPGLPNFAVYCESNTTAGPRNVSYWHEVPLNMTTDPRDGTVELWVTNEIPKGTNAKIETQTTWAHTPMAQSITDPRLNRTASTLRYYRVGPSLVNYGGIPQTWEASDRPDGLTGFPSDNDPVDFLELGAAPLPVGGVVRVKLLGALLMIDSNETDFKVLVLSVKDPAATAWADIEDVPVETRCGLYEFFRTYKVAEGKAANKFWDTAANATTSAPQDWRRAFLGRDVTAEVLRSKHADWGRLVAGGCGSVRCQPLLTAVRQGGSSSSTGRQGAAKMAPEAK
ncbi:hypothetical protein GPECTOR_1g34 [Gonium pectorale]|uniref:inorganic diphosphatase n=1 Tax=Gonium pectorale TaxID=33097 RepID=A0A150H301_GONPE|nr:hypothetical protein GPECTOR_1g34 [Gonium pectorale]|eukprot:KXZ56383.1 hypothetical protein GPECTOR_1g34 [Gonium pectorale]